MILVITVGSKLTTLSQINRALNSGFAVEAKLFGVDDLYTGELTCVYHGIIVKMTDLRVSAYEQLIGKYVSNWEFQAIDRCVQP